MLRYLVASILSYVAMAALAGILFSHVFSGWLQPLFTLFRPADEQANTVIWAMSAQFVRTFFLTAILLICAHGHVTIGKSFCVAMILGGMVSTYHIANAASLPLPIESGFIWGLFDMILLSAGAVVFAMAYKWPRPQQSHQ